ncbi:hypothetical protein BC332_11829 [Capsicum chinense]|nr:hypothetical protein BC332_11829 [Capsicum chinense]
MHQATLSRRRFPYWRKPSHTIKGSEPASIKCGAPERQYINNMYRFFPNFALASSHILPSQVKLFLEEDCPSKVSWGSQHHLQLKRTPPSIIRKSSEGRQCLKQSKEKFSLSLAKWKCPPKFNLDAEWSVVAGEVKKQRIRSIGKREFLSPYASLDREQYYDDNQTPVIRITPIEEEADVEAPFHLTPSQTISCKLPDQPANQKHAPKYQTVGESQNTSQIKSQASGKPPANHNPVTQFASTCENPDQTKIFPDQPANQNHAPKYQTVGERQNTSQVKSQVSGKSPANHNPVTQFPSTCEHPDQTKIFTGQPANQNHAPKYQTVCENQNTSQIKSQVTGKPPANHNPVTQFPPCENPNIPGFDGDLTVAVAVAALANAQEQSSRIDRLTGEASAEP